MPGRQGRSWRSRVGLDRCPRHEWDDTRAPLRNAARRLGEMGRSAGSAGETGARWWRRQYWRDGSGLTQVEADLRYLQLAGGTMSGAIVLHADPVGALEAATQAIRRFAFGRWRWLSQYDPKRQRAADGCGGQRWRFLHRHRLGADLRAQSRRRLGHADRSDRTTGTDWAGRTARRYRTGRTGRSDGADRGHRTRGTNRADRTRRCLAAHHQGRFVRALIECRCAPAGGYEQSMLVADSTQTLGVKWVNVASAWAFKNALINANFAVNQRGYVSATATTGANQYTLDRWRVVTSGQNLSFTTSANGRQITAPAGGVEQVIEGANIFGGTYALSWTGTATATVNGSAVANGASVALTANTNATVRFSGGTVSLAQLELGTVGHRLRAGAIRGGADSAASAITGRLFHYATAPAQNAGGPGSICWRAGRCAPVRARILARGFFRCRCAPRRRS